MVGKNIIEGIGRWWRSTHKHLLDEEPASIHTCRFLVQDTRGGRMANPAIRRLDEESIDHGDTEHATHVHLVDTDGGCYLTICGGTLERDMLGNIVMVNKVEVGQVAELHLGVP
jgi:hypothetical protein